MGLLQLASRCAAGRFPVLLGVLVAGMLAVGCSVRGFDTQYNKGVDAYRAGDLPRATEHFEEAVDEKDDFHEAWFNLARTYDERAQDAEARRDAANESNDFEAANDLAILAADLRDRADRAYRRAIEIDPKAGRALVSYAMFLADQGDDESAETYLQQAVDSLPDRAYPRSALGYFVGQRGDREREKSLYDEALRREADHAMTHYRLGIWHEDRSEWAEAAASYERAIESDGSDAAPWRRVGYVYAELGDPLRAARALDRSILLRSRDLEGDPMAAETQIDAAQLYQQADRHRQAILALWDARDADPDRPEIARLLAISYTRLLALEQQRAVSPRGEDAGAPTDD